MISSISVVARILICSGSSTLTVAAQAEDQDNANKMGNRNVVHLTGLDLDTWWEGKQLSFNKPASLPSRVATGGHGPTANSAD
jgi:hypothetical protein